MKTAIPPSSSTIAAQPSVSTKMATMVQNLEQIQIDPHQNVLVYQYKEVTSKEMQVSISMGNDEDNPPEDENRYLSYLRN